MENEKNLCSMKYLDELFTRHGFRFSKSKGQNFLTESWVPKRIAESAGLTPETGVLEVGPGAGCLTLELAKRAGRVVTVELDGGLEPILQETIGHMENIEVIYADILELDIAETVRSRFEGYSPVCCANLPYNITTPAIARLMQAGVFECITVMIQREVAKRICASPGTSEYGAFTVFVNWHAEPRILFDVSPGCFTPRPKVDSAVCEMRMRRERPCEVSDEDFFFRVVRGAFNQRRKTLLNALSSAFSENFTRARIEEAIYDAGILPGCRGETLSIAEFAALANALYALK